MRRLGHVCIEYKFDLQRDRSKNRFGFMGFRFEADLQM